MSPDHILALIILVSILFLGVMSDYSLTPQTDSAYEGKYRSQRSAQIVVNVISLLGLMCFARRTRGKRRLAIYLAIAGLVSYWVLIIRASQDPFGNVSPFRAWQGKMGPFMDGILVSIAVSVLMK